MDEVAAELKRRGAEFSIEPRTIRPGSRIAFVQGPENVRIELVERTMQAFDLHLHTKIFSDCSFIDPVELINQAVKLRLHGIALTEHGMRWPDEKFNELRKLADPHGIILINGQEILASSARSGMEGEFLVFGLRKSLVQNYSAKELVARVHGERGIIVAAHPYKLSRSGKSHYYGAGNLIYELGLDALEYCHPGHNEGALAKVRKAMEDLGLPGTGGSDAHKIFEVGSFLTLFENRIGGEEDFIREIRKGNIRAEKRELHLSMPGRAPVPSHKAKPPRPA